MPGPINARTVAPPATHRAPAAPKKDLCAPNPGSKTPSCVVKSADEIDYAPRVPEERASALCAGGGKVKILDGFKRPEQRDADRWLTGSELQHLSDYHTSDKLNAALDRTIEAARKRGCKVELRRGATDQTMLNAYDDPKTVAVVHVGHGSDQGHPVTSGQKGFGPDALDPKYTSKRLRHVEAQVCRGGKDAAGFEKNMPEGAKWHGPMRNVTVDQVEAELKKGVPERLSEALSK